MARSPSLPPHAGPVLGPCEPRGPLLEMGVRPYEHFEPCEDASSLPSVAVPGTVLAVRLDRVPAPLEPEAFEALARRLRAVRRRHPSVVLAGVARGLGPVEVQTAFRALGPVGLRLTLDGDPSLDALRSAAARCGLRAGDVEGWLAHRFAPESATDEAAVRAAARLLAGRPRRAERAVLRAWLRRLRLPGRRAWEAAARALPAVLALQVEPSLSVHDAAVGHGYADDTSLSHTCRVRFGGPPRELRTGVGWEWLLEAWLERAEAHRAD